MTLNISVGTSEEFTNEHNRRAAICQKHILGFFDSEQAFKDEIVHIMRTFDVCAYKAMVIAADGGYFLVYYDDIRTFLKEMGVIVDEFDLWDMYKAHICYFGELML